MKQYELEIVIDEMTPCLLDHKSGTYVDTTYELVNSISPKTAMDMQKYEGWKFNWSDEELNDCAIYALYAENSKVTQGLIACREYKDKGDVKGYIEIALAEANPRNVGEHGRYKGIGAHLFAIACQLSIDCGYDGYVTFISKTGLIEHYIKTMHANVLFDRHMELTPEAAKFLIDTYYEKARDKSEK